MRFLYQRFDLQLCVVDAVIGCDTNKCTFWFGCRVKNSDGLKRAPLFDITGNKTIVLGKETMYNKIHL